jgi:hypothetical protein
MNRLISGMALTSALLFVDACNSDPVSDLQGNIDRLEANPGTLLVTVGKTRTTQVTAVDEQGNPIESSYEVTATGPGIQVKRDSTFLPIYSGGTLTVPPTAPTFQFAVTGTDFASTSFTLSAGGKDLTVPVSVAPDPANVPISTVSSTGPNASDPTVITAPTPFVFGADAAVAFDAGDAIVLSTSDDGTQLTILPPPGATSKGTVSGLIVPYLPQVPVSDSTDVALTISPTVPSQPGTNSPNTAPDVTSNPIFYDGGGFTGSDISGDGGLAKSQYYKFTPAADGDYTITANWGSASDVDIILCDDATCSNPDFSAASSSQPESATYTLTGGTTYYIDLVLFAGANPLWVSVSIQ